MFVRVYWGERLIEACAVRDRRRLEPLLGDEVSVLGRVLMGDRLRARVGPFRVEVWPDAAERAPRLPWRPGLLAFCVTAAIAVAGWCAAAVTSARIPAGAEVPYPARLLRPSTPPQLHRGCFNFAQKPRANAMPRPAPAAELGPWPEEYERLRQAVSNRRRRGDDWHGASCRRQVLGVPPVRSR